MWITCGIMLPVSVIASRYGYSYKAEGVRLELTTGRTATCFQDKLLIRPDTLYYNYAESEGIEPSSHDYETCLSRTV